MVKIGTDWFVKVKCPKPNKKANNREEHISICSDCPYVIWEEPEMVAGFMASMCGVRVGSIGMAADLDIMGEKLLGIEAFTKKECDLGLKLEILKQIKRHAENNGWKFKNFSKKENLKQLDLLIEFCKRAKAKDLDIRVWA